MSTQTTATTSTNLVKLVLQWFGAMFDKVDRQRQTLIATTKSFDEVLISFATASSNFFLSKLQKFFFRETNLVRD